MPTAEQQLASFILPFAPKNQRLIRAARKALRALVPAAHEVVYDNYNFLVIAYCPTEKVSNSYFSLGADKHGLNLFFGYNGTRLEDPQGLLQGSGAKNRFLRLSSAEDLATPAVRALIDLAVKASPAPTQRKGTLLIRSVSPKRRPRS